MSYLVSCNGGPPSKELLEGRKVLNIGHAGMGFSSIINPFNELPDNSMAAIKKAMRLGAHGVEVDVQMSKDSVLILYHDKYLDSKTLEKGCVNDRPASEIIGLEYQIGLPFDWMQNEKIIGLDSLFGEFNGRDTFPWIYLDIHSHNYCDETDGYRKIAVFARALGRTIEKHNVPVDKICPTSTYVPMLLELRKAIPGIKLWYEEDSDYEQGLVTIDQFGLDGIVLKRSVIPTVERIEAAQDRGIEVVFFGGKAKWTLKEMLALKPDVIQVNNVKAMKEILDEAEAP